MKSTRILLYVLAGVIILGGLSFAFIKYNPLKDDDQTAQLPQPIEKDQVSIGVRSLPVTFPNNPLEFYNLSYNYSLYETLATFDSQNKLIPLIATNWDNPDDLTWRFYLDPNAKFSDGTSVTADDVKYSYEYVTSNTELPMSQALPAVESMSVVDPYTIEIKTATPNPLLLNKIAIGLLIISKNSQGESLIGSGPYVLSSATEEEIVMLRNDNYWKEKPKAKQVSYKLIQSDKEKLEKLISGDLSFAGFSIIDEVRTDLDKAVAEGKIQLKEATDPAVAYIDLDTARTNSPGVSTQPNPLMNLKVRQAMHLAIDVDDMALKTNQKLNESAQIVSQGVFGYNPQIKRPDVNIDEAKKLLAEANLEAGFSLDLDFPETPGAAEQLQPLVDQLAKINITLKLVPSDYSAFLEKIGSGMSSAFIYSWASDTLDATEVLDYVYHTPTEIYGSSNAGYSNTELDTLIEEIDHTMNTKTRLEKMQNALKIATDDLAKMPLYQATLYWGMANDILWYPRLDAAVRASEIAGK